ncbi:hypothetical protein E2C01_070354 [Portunus trituberculatus]|uniref:Uncharacterized protein n=1 Tax=Portunus trituberculatus TaxID=210409 RepID=A0A5B7I124_PORTR|nr:hypothetical protein [Portunus trituberculatus]
MAPSSLCHFLVFALPYRGASMVSVTLGALRKVACRTRPGRRRAQSRHLGAAG